MKVLSIDTSQEYLGIGLIDDDTIIIDYLLRCKNKQSTVFFDVLSSLLNIANIELASIDLLAVTSGPGSFTGLRIGMSIAKTLAHTLNKPIVGISTLDVLATLLGATDYIICPTMVLVKDELFFAFYTNKENNLIRIGEIKLLKIPEFLSELKDRTNDKVVLVGSMVDKKYRDLFVDINNVNIVDEYHRIVSPKNLAIVGLKTFLSGCKDNPFNLTPLYLKDYYNPHKKLFITQKNR